MNATTFSMISLAVLIATIAFGFMKKLNIGILSFGIAMVLGMSIGMTQKQIIAGFNTSLFVILLGSMFLFSIAQLNGTIDLLAKKTVALAGSRGWAVPIFMYLLGFVVAILGPGTIPGFGIVAYVRRAACVCNERRPVFAVLYRTDGRDRWRYCSMGTDRCCGH
ncbi:transporter permease [Caproicibacter fermentans]|uniref:Dicarboxylate carrier MatC N-terminal domain-containing protein n=1 Tax=Caproicibacter fermentans TaxID=2576756 RepID=A0A7G8T7P6_9FIRM|nr:SLC13 family permease [Caproicibacter fermentans]QNK39637.1 hypothetical protein HCR03_12945 [Caproicibacter fermentans]